MIELVVIACLGYSPPSAETCRIERIGYRLQQINAGMKACTETVEIETSRWVGANADSIIVAHACRKAKDEA